MTKEDGKFQAKLLAVRAVIAPVTVVTGVITVPLPHPETVHSLTLKVIDPVEAAEVVNVPDVMMFKVLPTTLSRLAFKEQACKF